MISPLQVGQSPKFNVELTPSIEGSWRWQGTQSISFSPKTRWNKATRYTVLLKGPMQSVSGQKIGPYLNYLVYFQPQPIRYGTVL